MAENNCIYPLANQHAGQPCLVLLYCYRHPRQAPESVASANPFWWRGPMFGRALANQNAKRSSGFWLTSRIMAWDRANPVWPSKRLCLFCLFPRPISTVHLSHQSPLSSLLSLHTSRTDPLVPSLSFIVSLPTVSLQAVFQQAQRPSTSGPCPVRRRATPIAGLPADYGILLRH